MRHLGRGYKLTKTKATLVHILYFFVHHPCNCLNGKTSKEIGLVTFLMPPRTETTEADKGFFMVSKGTEVGINEGLFTYYYPPEVASGFWDFLVHE